MSNGTNFYKKGDIVLLPVPFSNLSQEKIRPAYIISSNNYNETYEDIVVCSVSSNMKISEFRVKINFENIHQGALLKNSRRFNS
jgi:mRNA interferase MazF